MKKIIVEGGYEIEINSEEEKEFKKELKKGEEFINLGESIINKNKIIGMMYA